MAATTADVTIGQLARETGCKIPTIRYYERIGLLPPPPRSAGNTRLYGPAHRARLGFIQHCRELGFSQSSIRDLLDLADQPDRPCEAVDQIARSHLEDVNRRMAQLAALKVELERMIGVCRGGQIADCRIIETLADHAHGQGITGDHR